MMNKLSYVYKSPMGLIIYELEDEKLVHMYFTKLKEEEIIVETSQSEIQKIIHQYLYKYFNHQAFEIDKNLFNIKATTFELTVYKELLKIKYGETKSYQDIASALNNKNLVRAIGGACKKNPIGILIPCHRVIHKNGQLGGYSGQDDRGLKQKLIAHEQMLKKQ